jgi:hypothetical protein
VIMYPSACYMITFDRTKGDRISRDLRQEHIDRHKEAEEEVSDEDINIADADNNTGGLDFPSDIENIGETEIRGLSVIGDYLATSSSDELLDPPITQVAESETKSDDKNEVIPSTYPPNASTSI